jgi:hypothetical protein
MCRHVVAVLVLVLVQAGGAAGRPLLLLLVLLLQGVTTAQQQAPSPDQPEQPQSLQHWWTPGNLIDGKPAA